MPASRRRKKVLTAEEIDNSGGAFKISMDGFNTDNTDT